jgi:hypothetical protein
MIVRTSNSLCPVLLEALQLIAFKMHPSLIFLEKSEYNFLINRGI